MPCLFFFFFISAIQPFFMEGIFHQPVNVVTNVTKMITFKILLLLLLI